MLGIVSLSLSWGNYQYNTSAIPNMKYKNIIYLALHSNCKAGISISNLGAFEILNTAKYRNARELEQKGSSA